jgi:hypothetical protein
MKGFSQTQVSSSVQQKTEDIFGWNLSMKEALKEALKEEVKGF